METSLRKSSENLSGTSRGESRHPGTEAGTPKRRKKAAEPTKTCSSCKETKPVSKFYKRSDRTSGLTSKCKVCVDAVGAARKGKLKATEGRVVPKEKRCSSCHEMKPAKAFTRNAITKSGLSCSCRECAATWFGQSRQTVTGRSKRLLRAARERARAKGVPFNLTLGWIEGRIAAGSCELTMEAFHMGKPVKGRVHAFAPSIDRIVPEKGYTKKNCRMVLAHVNLAINEFGQEAFRRLCLRYLMQSDPKLFVRPREPYSEPYNSTQRDLFIPNHVMD